MTERGDLKKQHRVIGIRHTLKAFKEEGLIDDDTFYPDGAVEEIENEMLRIARNWYKIGARRGALETLDAILNGDFKVRNKKDGEVEIEAMVGEVKWNRGLNVTIGDTKERIPKRNYRLKIDKLGFK